MLIARSIGNYKANLMQVIMADTEKVNLDIGGSRWKGSRRNGKGGQPQKSESGGTDSEMTSDEEGEEDDPMNGSVSDDPTSPQTLPDADLPEEDPADVKSEGRSDTPSSMTRADMTSTPINTDTSDSRPAYLTSTPDSPNTTTPSVIVSMASFVSKTDKNFSKTTKDTSSKSSSGKKSNVASFLEQDTDKPLDLSTKTHKEPKVKISNGHSVLPSPGFPSSLQSLQQRFGGDFPIEPPRRPSSSIPLQSTITQGKPLLRSPLIVPSPNHSKHSPTLDSNHKSRPSPKSEKGDVPGAAPTKKSLGGLDHGEIESSEAADKNNKYTMHTCSCQKMYTTLYALSMHLQESGHVPGTPKAASLMDYPKLVRGQDMWLNQESEQTRRILRCMQCGESFKSLPMLTVHMMKTQHYTKIVSSDHGRRSHKCSAYCDKELDRECIFKCKVCHDTFTDMEGLANHMILSGHHKRQALRTQNYPDLGMRARRKRYYSDDSNSCATPTVASLLEYKRKCISHSSNGFSPPSEMPSIGIDSSISCENCGHKIEMHNFVEHVRLCLRQKADVIGALKHKLALEESSKHHKFRCLSPSSKNHDISKKHLEILTSYNKSSPSPTQFQSSSPAMSDGKKCDVEADGRCHDKRPPCSPKEEATTHKANISESRDCNRERTSESPSDKMPQIKREVDDDAPQDKPRSPCAIKQERSPSLSPSRMSISRTSPSRMLTSRTSPSRMSTSRTSQSRMSTSRTSADTPSAPPRERSSPHGASEPQSGDDKDLGELHPNLDIIDPNCSETSGKGSSALKDMESFIQRSFTSKFDHQRSKMRHIMNPMHKSTMPLPGSSPVKGDSVFNYFGKLRKFFNSFQSFDHSLSPKKPLPASCTAKHLEKSPKEIERRSETSEKNSTKDTKESEKKETPKKESNADSAKSPVDGEMGNDDEDDSDSDEPLVNKYLNVEGESSSNKSGSALDSLSSFVYGQPMTSEHPLDSLQRLLTRTDIPKILQQQMDPVSCHSLMLPSDLALPLNLSIKQSRSDDEDDERLDEQAEDLAGRDGGGGGSPVFGCDGELIEYKCAACSRQFASKGSYRYHLSRCHLSSVKKYGIKEAFNMSPYVYLPLDHTAKFTKYYEMAHELANKGK